MTAAADIVGELGYGVVEEGQVEVYLDRVTVWAVQEKGLWTVRDSTNPEDEDIPADQSAEGVAHFIRRRVERLRN